MQFFTYEYWFDYPPFITTHMLVLLLLVCGVLFVGGIMVQVYNKKMQDRFVRQVSARAGYAAAWIGAIGLVLTLARYEHMPIFMFRYWFLFLVLGAALWIFKIERYADSRREKLDEETRRFEMRDKYLKK